MLRMRSNRFRLAVGAIAAILVMQMTPIFYGVREVQAASKLDGILTNYSNKIYSSLKNEYNYTRREAKDILNDYQQSSQCGKHPRLILTDEIVSKQLKPIKSKTTDPRYELYTTIKNRADALVDGISKNPNSYLPSYKKMFEKRMPGPNGKGTAADDFRYKIMVLGLMYQLSDNTEEKKAYAEAAWTILDRVTNYYESDKDSGDNFKDINPWHNLDFGLFSQGLAIAYDWMYPAWNATRRARLEEAIVRLCFRVANDSFTPDSPGKKDGLDYSAQDYTNATVKGVYYDHNHNSFVNSGIAMAALAFMDVYPQITSSLCQDAFICMERNLNAYGPGGLSNESAQYWLMTVDNLSMVFSSMETALEVNKKTGSLYGLDTCAGMAGGRPIIAVHAIESDVGMFTFGDTTDGKVTTAGELYFYKHYNLKGYNTTIYNRVKKTTDDFSHLVQAFCWYAPQADDVSSLSRDWISGGKSAFATFRNHFSSGQTFLGVKAGTTVEEYFVHMYQGSFVFNSQGVKWAIDLGKDDYTIDGYYRQYNDRWKIFRLRPDGHNTLLIAPTPGDYGYALGKTAGLSVTTSDSQAKAVVNMTDLVSSKASSARRGFLLTDDRNSLVVRDEVTLRKTSDVYWVMYTQQSVSRSGNTITLTAKNGHKLTLDFVSSQAGEFIDSMDGKAYNAAPWKLAPTVKVDASHPEQSKNEDYKRIVYKVPNATGSLNITVKLTPDNVDKSKVPGVSSYGSIDSWNVKNTPTPTPTKKPSPTPTKKATNTPTPTKKATNTPTPTKKVTNTPTPTKKVTNTPTPTKKVTPSPTKKVTPTPTKKVTPTPTKKITPTPTKKVTPTPTKKSTPTPTKRPTSTPRPTNTPRPTSTPRPTNTPRPTSTPRPTNTPKPTVQPSLSGYVVRNGRTVVGETLKVSVRNCNCAEENLKYTWKTGDKENGYFGPTYVVRAEDVGQPITCEITDGTGEHKGMLQATFRAVVTPTPTSTPRPTNTPRPTSTPRPTHTPTPTKKSTPTPTKKATPTPTKKSTPTPTKKATPTPTKKSTPTPTKKATPTPTKKSTPTPTPTKKSTPTPTKAPTKATTKVPSRKATATATPTPTPTEAPTFEDFVERLYVVALNRESEPEGKEYWVNQVVEEGKTGADCARYFLLEAPEFMERQLSTDKFVETLYQTFFDRESDKEGKDGWVKAINSGKKTREEVVNDFIESVEWCNVCATYGVKSGAIYHKATIASKNATDFATRLYTCCLARDPEEDGLQHWSLALTNLEETGCSDVEQFFTSEEFVKLRLKNDEYIRRLYTTFMGREPAADEVTYWTGELKAKRQTRRKVMAFFGQSEEFTKICKQYGIDRGTI